MLDWLLRQLNITDDFVGHLDEVKLMFQHPVFLWIGVAVLPPLAWFIYRRQMLNLPTVPGWVRFTLTATRVVILALLFLVLACPYLILDLKNEKNPVLGL